LEERIIAHEAGVPAEMSAGLALLGEKLRNLGGEQRLEGPSTRILIYAGKLTTEGVQPRRACEIAVTQAMTDDSMLQAAIREVADAVFAP
jgi:nitric oxide reductase NorQ protein